MTRYIDAHRLLLDLCDISDDSMRTLFISYVKNQPTAEVIEVSKIEHEAKLIKADADGFKIIFREILIKVKSLIRLCRL